MVSSVVLAALAPAWGSSATCSRGASPSTTDGPPNVVLVVIDTLRADRLGCYGYERPLTPHLDALARRGVRFERAYSASSWTWPSTASILTALPPPAHGVTSHRGGRLPAEVVTVAEVLRDDGYATGAFSTNPLIAPEWGFDQGFDEFHAYEVCPTREVRADVEAWLAARGDEPFFLYLQIVDPHEYLPAAEHRARWVREAPDDVSPALWIALERAKHDVIERDRDRVEAHVAFYSDLYDATVAEADEFVGQLVETLRDIGALDRTVVAVTSDHGEEFLEHGQVLHAKQLHEESVRVPLILAGPGVPSESSVAGAAGAAGAAGGESAIPAGVVVDGRIENRHLATTLLALAGVDDERALGGRDLLDARDLREAARRPVFSSTELGRWSDADGRPFRAVSTVHAVRFRDLLYLWAPDPPEGARGERLFDLARDPAATRDLSRTRPDDCERLRSMIEAWLRDGARRAAAADGVGEGGTGEDDALRLLRRLGYVDDTE